MPPTPKPSDPQPQYADPFDPDKWAEEYAAGLAEDHAIHEALPSVHPKGQHIRDVVDGAHLAVDDDDEPPVHPA